MKNKDLSIIIDEVKLNIRVGAIIKYQNKILIEKNQNVDFSVIPGGRIKTLENSKEALLREINEELELDLTNEEFKLISIVENFFIFNDTKYHGLYLIYKVELKKDYNIKNGIINKDSQDSNYYLLDKEQIIKENIKPNILKEIIFSNEFEHYTVNEIN